MSLEPLDLDLMLARQAAAICQTRAALGDSCASCDDIHLLRYCLSFPKLEERLSAIRLASAWRAENAAALALVNEDQTVTVPAPNDAEIRRHLKVDIHDSRSRSGEPLIVSRASRCDPRGLWKDVEPEQLVTWILLERERLFRICDAETRSRRVLVKSYAVIDLSSVGLAHIGDGAYHGAMGRASQLSERIYPQLIGTDGQRAST